jgi:hypothetical protein
MPTVLALEFRIEEPLVPMAWRPFVNWSNCLPYAPGSYVSISRPAGDND